MSVEDVHSDEALTAAVASAGAALVYFWADWCKPCADVQRVLEELARKHGERVRFLRVEAEKQPAISERLGVTVVPTFVAFAGGVQGERIEGARVPEVVQCVAKLAAGGPAAAAAAAAAPKDAAAELRARLHKLVNYAPVMLFMKGTPAAPQCGFSRQAVELLSRHNVRFSSFNILDHPDVRTGLKETYNWPTFPQLYVKGQLVGGLDIMKELDLEGQLLAALPAEAVVAPAPEAADLTAACRELTLRNPVMLMMKGTPDAPACGFSNAAVQLLRARGIRFGSFDVFSSEELRGALKEYASWPTFPMLFVNGQLLGGLDILKEMDQEGSLLEAIPPSNK